MLRRYLCTTAFLVALASPLMAGTFELCVENPARLDESTLRAFRTELVLILAVSNRAAAFTDCGPGIVRITLSDQPPGEEPSGLGRIRYENGRFVPEIEIFATPIARIVGTRLPTVLGRAVARVATHELGHWLSQEARHARHGVMMEALSAGHLRAPGRSFFRLPPGD